MLMRFGFTGRRRTSAHIVECDFAELHRANYHLPGFEAFSLGTIR